MKTDYYMKKLLLAVAIILLPCAVFSQTDGDSLHWSLKDVHSCIRSTQYGAGYSNVLDTYLSPQEYRGMNFGILRENLHFQPWRNGKWVTQSMFNGNFSYTHNRVDNNNTLTALGSWDYSVLYRLPRLHHSLNIYAGGTGDIHCGFIYNLRNGNNPASALVYGSLGASGLLTWDFKVARLPMRLMYQAHLPLMGLRFSPHYGQSYYEIFSLDNSSGTVKFTSLHNMPTLFQKLSLDFPLLSATLRLSYVWDAQQSKLNHLKTHIYNHTFMVGFVKEFYMKPKNHRSK